MTIVEPGHEKYTGTRVRRTEDPKLLAGRGQYLDDITVHERLIELAARKLGMDRIEIRRRNFPAPEEFPYFTGAAFAYDSGRYAECLPYTGYGTGGSRAATLGGAAITRATERLKAKILRIAAQLLEAAPEDLDIEGGQIAVRGAPGRSVSTRDVGDAAYRRLFNRLPEAETPTLA